MSIKTFGSEALTSGDINTYLTNAGLVYIAGGTQSGTTALNVDNVFTSTYRNYRLVMTEIETSVADRALRINFRTGGATNATANYGYAYRGLRVNGVGGDTSATGVTYAEIGVYIGNFANALIGAASIDIYSPQIATQTFGTANAVGYEALAYQMRNGGLVFGLGTVFDGFQINLNGAGNVGFKWQLYGYRTA
jgi:hypothetical protein